MRKRAALLPALLLAGCNLAPPHARPPLASPAAYPSEVAPEGGNRAATEIGWTDFFADPRLRTLIAQALDNNRDLRISVARIAEARGQFRIQDAGRLPTLDATAGYTRSRVGAGGLGVGTGAGVGAGPGSGTGAGTGTGTGVATGTGGSFTFDRFSVGVAVPSFELDFWGRVRNLSEAARATYLSTVYAERAFRLSLIRDLAENYVLSRSLAERIELGEQTIKSRQDGLRIAKLRLDAGVTSALDYRQAETLLTGAETEVASLRNQRAQARNAVQLLVGSPIDEAALPGATPLAQQAFVRDLSPGLPSALLASRPDILASEEQLRAARANIGAARAAFFPTISLTGSFGFASTSLGGLFGSDGQTWSFGPSINLPIFDWGARKGNLDVAVARQDIAVATYERTVQTAFREVADALAGRRYLAEQIAAQERALEAQRRLAELARSRYLNGVAQFIEVLDAERNRFAAEQAMIELRRAELQSLVDLYVALGGGFPGWLNAPPVAPGGARTPA